MLAISMSFFISAAEAGWVNGYYRKDGTYVAPYYRSDPDDKKWNNYGPKDPNDGVYSSPYSRDTDHDGIPNYIDHDDDNDGKSDDDE